MTLGATDQIATRSSAADAAAVEREERHPRQVTLSGASEPGHSLVLRVGARSTSAVRASGGHLLASRTVSHGPVRLAASQAAAASASGSAAARMLRAAAAQVAERAHLESLRGSSCPVVGSAGIARAVIALGSGGGSTATLEQIHAATDTLGMTWVEARRGGPSHAWVEPMMVGAAILGAILEYLGAREIAAEEEVPLDKTLDTE